jgi:hypothetical protein
MVSIGDNRTESALVSQITASCYCLMPKVASVFNADSSSACSIFAGNLVGKLSANQNDEYQRDEIAAFC